MQGVFQHVKGVTSAVSGYAGGTKDAANYESVGSGRTGHAESVRVTYDPRQVSYGRPLQVYFSVRTTPRNSIARARHGHAVPLDHLPASESQARVARAYIAQFERRRRLRRRGIATTIEAGQPFFEAKPYHQDYLSAQSPRALYRDQRPAQDWRVEATCSRELYRNQPVLVSASRERRRVETD